MVCNNERASWHAFCFMRFASIEQGHVPLLFAQGSAGDNE